MRFPSFDVEGYKPGHRVMTANDISPPVHTGNLVVARSLLFEEIQITAFKPKSPPIPTREHLTRNPSEVTDSIELGRSWCSGHAWGVKNSEGILVEDEAV